MCGIAGFVTSSRLARAELESISRAMNETLVHRGPDSGGTWTDEGAGVALGHRRLAILDLSPEGAQPMQSRSGRFLVSFNGEIYNHDALRERLVGLGHEFRGHSDTEVLLAAVEQWGVVHALEQFNGMFAIALWDREGRVLHLARDRMGEKPLYYGWLRGTFAFASELKALRVHPDFDSTIDRDALASFMRHGYVPAPYSIYASVRKLVPAELLTVSLARPGHVSRTKYWSHYDAARIGVETPFLGSPAEAVTELDSLLRDAVKLRMHADVPLGAFLSGGIDSSTVVALMQAQSTRPIRTFTIGFTEARYNEAMHAKGVARHLGTEHTELYLTPREALDVIPRLPVLYDEPFADSSQIPTFLVSQLARRHVTVSLSGDGGDELFCGYGRYAKGLTIWNKIRWLPPALRALGARALRPLPTLLAGFERAKWWAAYLEAVSRLLGARDAHALYRALLSLCDEPTRLVPGSEEPATIFTDVRAWPPELRTLTGWMMFVDSLSYLPDDILVKVDRASMGVSLESRVPLLDHRVVEMAWRLPEDVKLRNGVGKWILRQVLYRYVPKDLVERQKMGFAVPIDAWLAGPLREWACDLVSEERLRRQGYLEPALVQRMLHEHLSGRISRSAQLWNVLMFQAWLAGLAEA